jgi:hypothetical protein
VAAAGLPGVQIALTPLSDRGERIAAAVTGDLAGDAGAADVAGAVGLAGVAREAGAAGLAEVAAGAGGWEVVIDRKRQAGRGYYRDLCFKVNAYSGGEPSEVGDGGFTDWTARLTANQKERLLICGVGIDRLAVGRLAVGR